MAALLRHALEAMDAEVPGADAAAAEPSAGDAEAKPAVGLTATVVRQVMGLKAGKRVSEELTRIPPAQEATGRVAAVGEAEAVAVVSDYAGCIFS